MKHRTWAQATVNLDPKLVAPSRALREPGGDVLQYRDGGKEFLAVKGLRPYGELIGQRAVLGAGALFEVVDQSDDYTVLVVPDEVLSLDAITRGTGYRNALLLNETYYRAGQAIGTLAGDITVPLLSVEDIAVVRETGDVLFIPPVAFGQGSQDLHAHSEAFANSMAVHFSGLWTPDTMNELTRQVRMGVAHDGIPV